MMNIDIITVLPALLESPFAHSIMQRAQTKGLVNIRVHNLRDYSKDKHKNEDDYQYGGGAGMVMSIEPFANCIEHLQKEITYDEIIYLTPDAPPQSGTSFYRHKVSKIRHNDEINWDAGEGIRVFNQHTFIDPTPYERVDTVGNVFNRLVIFDGKLLHSGHDYFGWDIASSRLFQIFFFD